MVVEDAHNSGNPHVVIYAPAETLTCKICGKDYVSRGKHDPGYCRDCEERMKEKKLVGGILDGTVVH